MMDATQVTQLTIAQTTAVPTAPSGVTSGGLWSLFLQSFDIFTVLLLIGSFVGVAIIVRCVLEIRESAIAPAGEGSKLAHAARAGDMAGVRDTAARSNSLLSRVVKAALAHAHGDRTAMREAAELSASEESARWFRKLDPLNMIGNLGPLVGLAGTVWGMILAFTSLREAGDQAHAADLSQGISKALFHTLLGLCLAIPCLVAYSLLRNKADRLCTRAIVEASEVVEALPAGEANEDDDQGDMGNADETTPLETFVGVNSIDSDAGVSEEETKALVGGGERRSKRRKKR